MNFIQKLINRFSKPERMIILSVILLAFPFYICVPLYIIQVIYLFKTKEIQAAFKNTTNSKYLLYFLSFSFLVSLFFQNYIGIIVTLALVIIISIMLYYRVHINASVFDFIVELIIMLSIFWAIIGFYEYLMILEKNGIHEFMIKIYARRENRLNSVMFNANYYASSIEMVLLLILYQFIKAKNQFFKQSYYSIVAILNCFILFLSGTRTSWIALLGAVFIFFIINKNYKWCALFISSAIVIVVYFLFHIDKIPRVEYLLSNLGVRGKIWSASIHAIIDNPLFGRGPMTYMQIYEQYQGHNTHHAHSIYLEPILSYGLIGVGLWLPYLKSGFKNIISTYHQNRLHFALMVSAIVTTLIHGVMDYSMFFIHPGFLLLFIICSSRITSK